MFADATNDLPLEGLRVLRPGTPLAVFDKGRFELHHSFAMAVSPTRFPHTHAVSEAEALAYLAGQALPEPTSAEPGFALITYEGLALGWGKAVSGRINNLYPKGLRRHDLLPAPISIKGM